MSTGDAVELALRAMELRAAGLRNLALKDLEAAIAMDPRCSLAFAGLAICRAELNDLDGALEAARTALSLDPSNVWAHGVMTGALYKAGRIDDAISSARTVLSLDPTSLSGLGANLVLAESLSLKNAFSEALVAADEATRIDPQCSSCHVARATALRGLRRLDEAREAAQTGLALAPQGYWSLLTFAQVATSQRDFAAAIPAFREALRLRPLSSEMRRKGWYQC